jgi:hypothetical protein
MLHLLVLHGDAPLELLHPFRYWGYQFWSGIGSDLAEVTLITGAAIAAYRWKRNTECHVEAPKNCHRFGRPVPGTGHRACRLHHPHAEEKGTGITPEDILRHHEESGA